MVAFRGLDADGARSVLQRLREQLVVLVGSGDVPPFTVSFGVSDRDDGSTLDELVQAADRALLTAKRTGRDRIVQSSDPQSDDIDLEASS